MATTNPIIRGGTPPPGGFIPPVSSPTAPNIGPFSRPYTIVDVGSLDRTSRTTLNGAATRAGQAQATVAGLNTALPIVYGRQRIGARITAVIVYQNNLVLRCAWCIGEVHQVVGLYLNDEPLPSTCTATHYVGSNSQTRDPTLYAAFAAAGKTYSDTLAGDGLTRPGVCYSVVVIPPGVSNGFPRLVADIAGIKVRGTEAGARSWSQNPAYIIADFIDSPIYGMGRTVDWASVSTLAAICGASIGSPAETRRLLDLVIANPQSCETWLNVLREYVGCWAVPEGSTYRLIADALPTAGSAKNITAISKANPARITSSGHGLATGAVVKILSVAGMTQINNAVGVVSYVDANNFDLTGINSTSYSTYTSGGTATQIETSAYQFGTSNVLANSLRIAKRGVLQSPTVVSIGYTDQSATPFRDGTATRYASGVLEGVTPRRESRISLPGIARYSEAYRAATERLNAAQLADLSVSFVAFDIGVRLQVGDLVDITHPAGLSAKVCRIAKIDPIDAGRWQISAVEWDPAVYSSDVISGPSVDDTTLPSPTAPPTLTGLYLTEEVYQVETGRYASRIRATWTEATTYPFVAHYAVEVRQSGAIVDSAIVPAGTASYVTPALAESLTYQVSVAIVSTLNVKGTAATSSMGLDGKASIPSDVTTFSGSEIGGEVRLAWTPAVDLDLTAHEIRYSTTGGSWATATLIDRVAAPAVRYQTRVVPEGTWRFWIKGLDSIRTATYPNGQESANAAYVDIAVTSDSDAYVASSGSFSSPLLFNMTQHTDESGTFWVTDHAQTWNALFTSTLSTYSNPLFTYHTAAASSFVTEIDDVGLALTGDWTGSFVYSVLDGTEGYSLDLNEVGPEGAKTITAATNATPIVITATAHGYVTGDEVEIANVGGNTAANGYRRITKVGADTFSLQDLSGANVAGNGAYTSGGTAQRWIWTSSPSLTASTTARFVRMRMNTTTGTLLVRSPGAYVCDVVARREGGIDASYATYPGVVTLSSTYTAALAVSGIAIGSEGHYAMIDQIEVSGGIGMPSGRALLFNATGGSTGSYVSVGDYTQYEFGNGTTDSNFSLEFRTKRDVISESSWGAPISKGGGSGTSGEWTLRITGRGAIEFAQYDASAAAVRSLATNTNVVPANLWTHVAITYDSALGGSWYDKIKVYVDGVIQPTSYSTSGSYTAMEATTHQLVIGAEHDAGYYTSPFSGQLDEVRVWNVARSQANIQAYMRASVTVSTTGLVGYWKLDETSGYTATDSQTYTTARNGTLGSGTQFNGGSSSAPTQKWWRPMDGFDVYRFDAAGAQQAGDVSWSFSGV